MFDVAPTELMLVALVALLVIGPKDLPKAMRFVGQWVAKARTAARHFRSGIDTMVREAELEEMQKKWAEVNAKIMAEHPLLPDPDAQPTAAQSSPGKFEGYGEASMPATDAVPTTAPSAGDAATAAPPPAIDAAPAGPVIEPGSDPHANAGQAMRDLHVAATPRPPGVAPATPADDAGPAAGRSNGAAA